MTCEFPLELWSSCIYFFSHTVFKRDNLSKVLKIFNFFNLPISEFELNWCKLFERLNFTDHCQAAVKPHCFATFSISCLKSGWIFSAFPPIVRPSVNSKTIFFSRLMPKWRPGCIVVHVTLCASQVLLVSSEAPEREKVIKATSFGTRTDFLRWPEVKFQNRDPPFQT